jgi:hypothetical protein
MGRYYTGDINGKFWFAVQDSDCASRFGGQANDPQYIEYYFDTDHLDGVMQEINNIQASLGDNLQKIEKFFADNHGYNNDMLKEVGITEKMVSDYADLGIGIQIRDCIIEQGYCTFDAEL